MSYTKEEKDLAWKTIQKEDMVLVCQHVLDKTVEAEYHKEDDSYVCSSCRDVHSSHGEKCTEECMRYLSMVHRSCLGV